MVLLGASVMIASVSGCDGAPPALVMRDSAGVAIVESAAPAWERAWEVAAAPSLVIGGPMAEGPEAFDAIASVHVLRDGRIAVVDGASQEIRFFDSAGVFLSRTGREGGGPDEYHLITGFGQGPNDSLWVFDFGSRRFTVLGSDGTLSRTVSLGGDLSAVVSVGRLVDGAFVIREAWSSRPIGSAPAGGLRRDRAAIVRISSEGGPIDTVTLVLGREVFLSMESGRAVMSAPLFVRHGAAVIWGDAVVVGDQERYELRAHAPTGELRRIIRRLDVDLSITPEAMDTALEARIAEEEPARRAALRRTLAELPIPPTRPAFGDLLPDESGNLWVSAPTNTVADRWAVFAPTGALLGEVRLPPRFELHQVGPDWVIGVWRDELDVEHVARYELIKGVP